VQCRAFTLLAVFTLLAACTLLAAPQVKSCTLLAAPRAVCRDSKPSLLQLEVEGLARALDGLRTLLGQIE
jgi:hypothetical protein